MNGQKSEKSFTLLELLVVVAVIVILVAILLPTMAKARLRARMVVAHSDLRQITIAVQMYRDDNVNRLPPTRGSCNLRMAYELPIELMPYLIKGKKYFSSDFSIDEVAMKDPFTGDSYKYRAPGAMILNETVIVENAANIWVQDNFPGGDCRSGRYYNDPKTSPVRYAVWSSGPEPNSPMFDLPGHLPVPYIYWLDTSKSAGVLTHFEDIGRQMHISP